MVHQLSIANESEAGGCVVILADDDKEAMEERVIEGLGSLDPGGTRVICRGGKPFLISDLRKVSAHKARPVKNTLWPGGILVPPYTLESVSLQR
jgi:hypothetical protein